MDAGALTFIIAILIVGVLIFLTILLTGRRGHHFNIDYYFIFFII